MSDTLSSALRKAPPGSRAKVCSGSQRGTWIKLDPSWDQNLEPCWANVRTGLVLHYSWLIEKDTELILAERHSESRDVFDVISSLPGGSRTKDDIDRQLSEDR